MYVPQYIVFFLLYGVGDYDKLPPCSQNCRTGAESMGVTILVIEDFGMNVFVFLTFINLL